MQHAPNCPSPPALGDDDINPTFNVVIAYEDFDTGKRAKETYDFLAHNLGRDCALNNEMWKFDVLRIPKLREIAVKDAAQADIIIVSSHGGSELPSDVKLWVESWLKQPLKALALVALFDGQREGASASRAYLVAAAKRAGIGFFAQPDDVSGQRTEELLPPFAAERAWSRKALFTLVGAVQREMPSPRWESND